MPDYKMALLAAVRAAREAGKILRADFLRSGGPRGSGGHAEADEQAEQIIRRILLEAFPAAYRGEESGSAGGDDNTHVWLVDPNDGTSAYLKGWRGSAVSIAMLRDGKPVLGVVHAFCYPGNDGDLIAWAEGCGPITRNGNRTITKLEGVELCGTQDVPSIVFVSHSADKNPSANTRCTDPARYIAIPSIAYRLARVAAGDGVAAVSLNAPGDWDYAAGHALLLAAGGVLIDERGKSIAYSQQGESHCNSCYGGAPAAAESLRRRDWSSVRNRESQPQRPYCLTFPERGRVVADSGRLSRAQGCLIGQLVGDSLGGLVEFQSAASIKSSFPNGVRDLVDGGHWNVLAGQPTDDSELALMLSRTLVDGQRYDASEVLESYIHWYQSPPFDIGGTTAGALAGAGRGKTSQDRLREAASQASRDSQANGSLMRVSPLGIFGAGRAEQAADWARQDSRLTHPNQVCQDSCAVFGWKKGQEPNW
jgi:fructose-1,6-bisphosphatase/inositol monophosphatase family enzyme